MRTVILCFFAIFALSLSGCRSHDGHGRGAPDEDDAPSRAITHWTEHTELFVEFPVLIVGQESPFAAHLTRLSDFKAIDAEDVHQAPVRAAGKDDHYTDAGITYKLGEDKSLIMLRREEDF